jgi:hypothetical protein
MEGIEVNTFDFFSRRKNAIQIKSILIWWIPRSHTFPNSYVCIYHSLRFSEHAILAVESELRELSAKAR